jgi:hypothetical protein
VRFRSIALVALTCVAFSSILAEEKNPLPQGVGPEFFILRGVSKDALDIQRVNPSTKDPTPPEPIRHKVTLKDVRATDPKGKSLTMDEIVKRVRVGGVIMVSDDADPIDPVYLAVLKEETVVLTWVKPRKYGEGIVPAK